MSHLVRRLVWLAAVLGLVASSTSLYVHHRLLLNPSYRSFCDVNATVSCTDAYLSPYGSVFGIPVALFGVIFFASVVVLCVFVAIWPSVLADSASSYIFLSSTLGVAAIVYLAYAAFFILRAICLLCVTTYVAVVALFILSSIGRRIPMHTLPRRLVTDVRALVVRPLALLTVVLFVGASTSAVAYFSTASAPMRPTEAQSGSSPAPDAQLEAWWMAFPRIAVPVSAAGAAVVIVKFTDYQCTFCGQTFQTYGPIIVKYQNLYPGKVAYISKDYPLQPDCNNNITRPLHLAACDAAVAVRLAKERGKGDALEAYFYAHQPFLTPASVREYAATIGGVPDLAAGYARALDAVKADVALGRLLGLRVTPTFFINGVRFDGGVLTPEQLDFVIQYELKKAGVTK